MHPGSPSRRRLLSALVALVLGPLLVAAGCGSPEEPSEIPASPPPGKGLPRFAAAGAHPPRTPG